MPLEAVMIAVDNSEWTRNGDYAPTRFSAQNEAVGYLANAKLQENQESSVGLMSMAGNRIEVITSPGREPGQLLNALARVQIGGQSNVIAALKTAQLALKNRQNKNQRQRVILFVASPLDGVDVGELVKLGKLLKKNNVAVDVINFGTENTSNDNTEKLEQLIAAVNTADNSHLVSIPPGPHIFADLVLTSAIMQSGGGGAGIAGVPSGAGGGAAGGGGASVGGIDPNMDPEMAMAIRMSMEEERQRQQKAAGATAATPSGGAAGAQPPAAAAPMEEDEDALLAQAIALSMQENADAPMADAAAPAAGSPAAAAATPASGPASAGAAPATPAAASAGAGDVASAADIDLAMQDPDFLNSLLAGVPGAEGAGASVDSLLDELQGGTSAAGTSSAAGSSSSGAKPAEKKDEDKK